MALQPNGYKKQLGSKPEWSFCRFYLLLYWGGIISLLFKLGTKFTWHIASAYSNKTPCFQGNQDGVFQWG